MAWIAVVEPEEAKGALQQAYEQSVQRAGKIFNIVKVQSLNPRALQVGTQLYVTIMRSPSELSRAEREMLGTVVSWVNHCVY